MNHRLPISLAVIVVVVAFQFVSRWSSQAVDRKEVAAQSQSPDVAAVSQNLPSGQELVTQAAQRLLLLPGIEAKTRQRVNIFGQHLVGSGTYLQLANGPRLMLRLDLILQVATQSISLQQISDGDTFWVRRSQGEEISLSRVNLRRLRDAASRVGPSDVPPPPTLWMALGGLPKLMAALDMHFAFDSPQPMTIGQLPVWSLEGYWKPAVLANLLPDQKAAIEAGEPADLSALPPYLPHGVTIILGRDQVIPLFPYGISYYRLAAADRDEDAPRREPMATWELFEVRFRPDLDASQFDYRPHDAQQVDELTEEYIARLQSAMQRQASGSSK
ncbi:MAG: hypothetical protein ACYC6N_15510 [Pirellulaceae bacterium]